MELQVNRDEGERKMARLHKTLIGSLPPGARTIGRQALHRMTSASASLLGRQAWSHSLRFLLRSREGVFSQIYAEKAWGSEESGSGTGSELRATENIRAMLPEILKSVGARAMLDAPCGDWNWMQHVPLPVERYYGADIVPAVIAENRRTFSRPGVHFLVADITKDPLPKVDLVLCRDCLVHLSYADIRAALSNLKKTGARYILLNTYPHATENRDQFTGAKYRFLDMTRPPFNFPAPLQAFPDGGDVDPNMMGLWRLDELPEFVA
jgi:SAM-dependent methyltransferase